jgi:hypothetical protein
MSVGQTIFVEKTRRRLAEYLPSAESASMMHKTLSRIIALNNMSAVFT